jgi:hypothetical protein
VGPAPKDGVYHKPREEDFTDYWRHESQTSRKIYYASKIGDGGDRERKRKILRRGISGYGLEQENLRKRGPKFTGCRRRRRKRF